MLLYVSISGFSQNPATIPYYTDFSASTDVDWQLDNASYGNKWMIGTPGNIGSPALFITNDNTNATYAYNSESIVIASKTFNVGAIERLAISFDAQIGGESYYDYMKVFLVPDSVNLSTSSPNLENYASYSYSTNAFNFSSYKSLTGSAAASYPYILNLTEGTTISIGEEISNPLPMGGDIKLVFLWKNDGTVGVSPGAVISNLSVSEVNCIFPAVSISNILSNEATITWQNTGADGYYLQYKMSEDTSWISIDGPLTDTFYVLDELLSYTSYMVRVAGECNGEMSLYSTNTFQTTCDVLTPDDFPFTENFDQISMDVDYPIPDCWSRFTTASYPYPYVYEYYSHSSPNSLFFSYNEDIAALPPIDVTATPINSLQLSFALYSYSYYESNSGIVVGVMTNPSDISTFVAIDTVLSVNDEWIQTDPVFFSNYTGQGNYIALKHLNTLSLYVDDIVVELIPSCPKPTNLMATNLTTDSVTLSWDANTGSAPQAWEVMINGVVTSTNDNPLQLEIESATEYNVMVRNVCDDEDTSAWSTPIQFFSPCLTYIVDDENPYFEGFEGSTLGCWSSERLFDSYGYLSSYDWEISTSSNNGIHGVSLDSYGAAHLISPVFDLTGLTSDPILTFAHKQPLVDYVYTSYFDALYVLYRTSDTSEWQELEHYTTAYSQFTVDTIILPTNTYQIAFKGYGDGGGGMFLDDIRIGAPASCPAPSQFIGVSSNSTSVLLTWNEIGDATEWNVAYNTSNFDPNGEEVELLPVFEDSLLIENLENNNTYYFYVQSNCGSETSIWSGPVVVMTGTYNMATSGTDTLHTCDIYVFDDGGPNGDYSDNVGSTLVIYPAQEGAFLQLEGVLNTTDGEFDYLIIYDGVGTQNELFNTNNEYFSQTCTIPRLISTTGPLTVYFYSDYLYQGSGFELFVSCVSCISPQLTVSNVGTDYATLTWADFAGTQTDFEFFYGPAGTTPESEDVDIQYLNETSITLDNLESNTSYVAYIRTVCEEEGYSNWNTISFSTLNTEPAQVPYICDFEDAEVNAAWTRVNGNQINKWFIGGAVNHGGDSSLYISNNNGVTNAYNNTAGSTVWAYRDIQFSEGDEFSLSFDYRVNGDYYYEYDYMIVYLVSPVESFDAGSTIIHEAAEFGPYFGDTVWTSVNIVLDNTYTNTTQRLLFMWHNSSYGYGYNPPAAVDNISIVENSCIVPQMSVYEVTANTATLTWNNTEAVSYIIEYMAEGDSAWTTVMDDVTDTTYQLTDLDPATNYIVQMASNCGDDTSFFAMATFNTPCSSIIVDDNTPYTEGWEGSDLDCWESEQIGFNIYDSDWSISSYDSYSGSQSIYMSYYSNARLISPVFDLTGLTNEPELRFFHKQPVWGGTVDDLTVYYRTSSSDSWHELVTYNTTNYDSFTEESIILPNPTATYQIAFVGMNNDANGIYIDDIRVGKAATCPKPTDFTVDITTQTSIVVSWIENGEATSWNIEYGNAGFLPGNGTIISVSSNPTTITGLTASTRYELYVQADCGVGDLSDWVGPIKATTACDAVDLPYTEDFDSYQGSSATASGDIPICWDNTYNGFVDNYTPHVYNTSFGNYPHSGTQNLGFYSSDSGVGLAVLPEFSTPLNRLVLDFYYLMENSSYGTMKVGYITNVADASTFVEVKMLASIDHNSSAPVADTVDFSAVANVPAAGRIAFKWVCTSSTYYTCAVDDIHVAEADTTPGPGPGPQPTCEAPSNLHQTNVSVHEVTLEWEQEGTPDSWTVSYRKSSSNTWTTASTTTHPYTITNLEAEMTYEAYVEAECEGVTSPESNHITFVTEPDGVDAYELAKTKLYPNPTTGLVSIRNEEVVISEVNVYDVYGKLQKSEKVDNNNANLDLSSLANGMYIVRIVLAEGSVITRNVVKQ